ncbi:hypothetical protein Q7P37_002453 [Cladosporium fusiforme]
MFSGNVDPFWTFPDQLRQSLMSTDAHHDPATKPTEQAHQVFGQEAVSQLTSYEQRDLLDAVDKLRRANISGEDFSIPQVIVCGDQSTGKSSVLEAISQLRFPVAGGRTTTRLATEVVLRNTSSPSIAPVTLTIIADKSRTQEQKAHLEGFSFKVDVDAPDAFPDAINAALEYLRSYEPLAKFWYDRLHVEISGPRQPNLTLVDLPGLIQIEANANPGDKQRIKNLVKQYISEPKAVVLAVVSANTDVANQEVTQLVKDHDAANRTMGILTKTDCFASGSEEETAAIRLACNRDGSLSLGLGWHALRNMPHQGSQSVSYEHRDEVERSFFAKLPWSQLDPENAGILALREKLSLRLFGLITYDLDNFVSLMESKLEECRLRQTKLGTARDSTDSQGYYLQRIQRELQNLIQDALDGRQERSDFASFFDGSSHKALRTTINRYSRKFATRMRERGKQYNIFGTPNQRNQQFMDYSPEVNEPNFFPPYKPNGIGKEPSNISLEAYCQILASFMDDTRGTSLLGFQSSSTQTAIFRQQSVHWETISKEYVEACYVAALDFLKCAVMHVGGRHTGEKLMHAFIDRSFNEIGSRLEQRLNDLLWPYQKSHPSTQNPNYSWRVTPSKKTQRSQNSDDGEVDGDDEDGEEEFDSDDSWADIAVKLNYQHELVFAAEALDITDAYYDTKLALDTFIDNVTILGVEAVLLNDIKDLLSYKDVAQLGADRLAEIAAEPPGAQQEREKLGHQIAVLIEVIRTCKKYKRTSSSYSNFTPPTNGTQGKSPHAAKGKAAQPAGSDEGATASKNSSTFTPDSPTHTRPGNLFAGRQPASCPPPAKSGSMSNGHFGSSSSFNFGSSAQSTSVDSPFASRLAPHDLPGSSGANGIFGSSSKSDDSL